MDEYEGEETGRITLILTGIFEEKKDLNDEMKKITSENRETQKINTSLGKSMLRREKKNTLKIRRTRE